MPSDESSPAPRRRWWPRSRWLRRGAFLATGTLVGLLALRLAWGFVAERRLNALIASYRADGGPVLVDEFNAELDSVPDEDNAAVLYRLLSAVNRSTRLPTVVAHTRSYSPSSTACSSRRNSRANTLREAKRFSSP